MKFMNIVKLFNGDKNLKVQRPVLISILLTAGIVLFSGSLSAAAAGRPAILTGVVLDQSGNPFAEVKIVLVSGGGLFREETKSAGDGSFALSGIPAGECGIYIDVPEGIPKFSPSYIILEPAQTVFVRIIIAPAESGALGSHFFWLDLTDVSARTVIDEFQVQSLPSANNAWSLIENQDFSATTNRIDIGGVWASLPALWSSRGSVSWTQSSYLINGMDATDPYDTGTPLFYPDIEALRFVVHDNGRFPIANSSPGGAFDLIPRKGTPEYHGSVSAYFTAPGMSSGSIPQRLKEEGLNERTKLSFFGNAGAQFSGPVVPEKLYAGRQGDGLFGTAEPHLSPRSRLSEPILDRADRPSSHRRGGPGCPHFGNAGPEKYLQCLPVHLAPVLLPDPSHRAWSRLQQG